MMSTIAAISPAVAADRRCVTSDQLRSMKTKATSDCSRTTGAMMMISERANRPLGIAPPTARAIRP